MSTEVHIIGSTSTRGRGRSLLLVAAAVLTASGLVACGGGSSSGGSSGGAGSGGGTLVIDSSFDLKTVDPGRPAGDGDLARVSPVSLWASVRR